MNKINGGFEIMRSDIVRHICSIRDALNSQGRLDAVLAAILSAAMELTGAGEGGVLVAARDMSCLRIQVWEGTGVNLKSRIIPMDEGSSISAWALLNKRGLAVTDVSADQRYFAQSSSDILSELAVPVVSRGKALGVVNLESEAMGYFTEEHLESITALCSAVSVDWELSGLLDWQEREKEQSRALTSTTASLLNGSKSTLQAILEAALVLTHADIGGILTLDTAGDILTVRVAKNLRSDIGQTLSRGTGIVWRAIDTGQMQNVADVQQDSNYIDLSEGDIKSLLAAPLVLNGRPIGVINVESVELNHFSFEDADILKIFADQAAIAVSNARLLEQMEAAQAIAGLGSISGNLAHRMNNIVGGVRVLAGLLAKDLENDYPAFADNARRIESTAKEALDVVDQYEQLFSHAPEQVEIQQLLEFVAMKIKCPEGIHISVAELRTPITITTPRYQVCELVSELVRNAVKSLGASGEIHLAARETDAIIEITVSDNGAGIPQERLGEIFNRGFTERDDTIGKGFGLWWIKTYLQMLGGKITVTNKPNGGAHISVMIPKESISRINTHKV
jgi:GAF domain-containing protein